MGLWRCVAVSIAGSGVNYLLLHLLARPDCVGSLSPRGQEPVSALLQGADGPRVPTPRQENPCRFRTEGHAHLPRSATATRTDSRSRRFIYLTDPPIVTTLRDPTVTNTEGQPSMSTVTIKDVQTILTQPAGSHLIIVKVITSEPGLYGVGCATFTQRYLAVHTAIEEHLKPFLIGRDVDRIEEIWQMSMVHSYWRNGPVLSNAVSSGYVIADAVQVAPH